jgi:hypothetical protein
VANKADPWNEPHVSKADVVALQHVATGRGNEHHQKRVVNLFIRLATTYDLSFRPDEHGGERATAFAEGKRFVGLQVVKLLKADPTQYSKED